MPIPRKFYERDTVIVAKELVGKKIIRVYNKTTFSGIITETKSSPLKYSPLGPLWTLGSSPV